MSPAGPTAKNLTAKNRRVGLVLAMGVAGMVGLSYASVPLYQLFCQITGYGGTPRIGEPVAGATGNATGHEVMVTLDARVMPTLDWDFRPQVRNVSVRPGEETLAFYSAKNTGYVAVTGTATFNVSPPKIAQYVTKIDCFCFSEQRLEPGEEMPMPVSFYIDPEFLDDPDTRYLEHIVLSYTFHPSRDAASAADGTGDDNG